MEHASIACRILASWVTLVQRSSLDFQEDAELQIEGLGHKPPYLFLIFERPRSSSQARPHVSSLIHKLALRISNPALFNFTQILYSSCHPSARFLWGAGSLASVVNKPYLLLVFFGCWLHHKKFRLNILEIPSQKKTKNLCPHLLPQSLVYRAHYLCLELIFWVLMFAINNVSIIL